MKVLHSTKDSMNKIDREVMDQRYLFAMVITKKHSYNIHTNKEMVENSKEKWAKKMSTECPAIETQKADNMVHSENIYLVLTIRQTISYILGIYIYLPEPKSPALKGLILYSGGSGGMRDRH